MVFEDMRAFISVARSESFARASANLCVAQSALSKRVHRLESQLGEALFERHARGVTLTETGQAFFQRAVRLVEEVEEIEKNLSSFTQVATGRVCVAMPQRTSGLLAPPVVERCMDELPLVDVEIFEGTPANVHGWLMRGDVELALTYNSELGTGYDVLPLFSEPLFFCVATKALKQHFGDNVPENCSISDLGSLPLIVPRKPDVVRVLIDRLMSANGIRPNVKYECDGFNVIYGLVKRGMGVGIVSLSTAWITAVESGHITAIPFSSPLVNWKLHLAKARKTGSMIAVQRVHSIIRQEMEGLIQRGAWPNAKPLY